MQQTAAAKRYARALFGIKREENQIEEGRQELRGLASLLDENEELHSALLTPLRPAAERKAVVVALAAQSGFSQSLRRFLSYLIDQRRLVALDAIVEEYERLADEATGLVTAEVVTATPLDDARRERLRSALSSRSGRDVRLEVTIDPSLIGGAVARVGDLVFDGSLRTQLDKLRNNLVREA